MAPPPLLDPAGGPPIRARAGADAPDIASIGIVMHDLPLGGTERIALRLARAWVEHGVATTIFCGDPRGPLAALVPAGARLVAADPAIPRARGSRARLGHAAARFFAHDRVDALFVTGNYHWEVVPALAAIAAAPPILVQISSPIAMPRRGRLRQRLFEARMRRLLPAARALVAMDEPSAARANRILGREVARVVALPALDDDAPPPLPPPTTRHLLAGGRLIRQKGFDLLIDAVAGLPDVTLTIAGEGPERNRLQRRIARHCLGDRVTLAGYVPDLRPLLDTARALVLPSRFEGYGAVIVEALAAGRPVIATRTTPAADDLIGAPGSGAERGLVVPPDDVPALARAIAALLAAPPPDPGALAAAVAGYRVAAGARAYLDLLA